MINQVVLVGRLTKDPDLRYTSSGSAVASFTLAVNRNFTNQSGNREADFINCVIWRKPAEAVANYAHKGTLIGVVGRIQTRSYENQQGQRVYVTEVVCENFQLLESRATQGHQDGVSGKQEQREGVSCGSEGKYTKKESEPLKTDVNNQNRQEAFFDSSNPFNGNSSHIDISDDDLPF